MRKQTRQERIPKKDSDLRHCLSSKLMISLPFWYLSHLRISLKKVEIF